MQIDGYSLDAQKTKMKAFCDYNEYEIAGEYEDAGKSGKLIEGRIAFNQMMDDIKSGKDEVSYVLPDLEETQRMYYHPFRECRTSVMQMENGIYTIS